nr:retention module-containing protein [uncultured Tolumonas sp.]
MHNQVISETSRVTTLTGNAKVKTSDGEFKDLKIGDILQPGTEVILTNASVFSVEKDLSDQHHSVETPVTEQPTMPVMGAANEQASAQINALQQAILSGQDPTQAFEAAAAGVPATAGGTGVGSGNNGFITVSRVGDSTIASAGYDTVGPTSSEALQIQSPAIPVVNTANNPTIVQPDINSVPEDTTATGNVLLNDSDTDDLLTVSGFTIDGKTYTAGTNVILDGIGTIIITSDGNYIFTPVHDWNGVVPQVTYTTNTGSSSTLDINITPVNDPPTIVVHTGNQENSNDTVYEAGLTGGTQAGEAETHAGGTFTLADADGLSNIAGITIGTTTIAIADLGHNNVINGSNGTLTITHYDSTTGDVTYTYDLTSPVANAAGSDRGSDSFTVTVHDADSGSSSASIVIDIVDDKPVARDDSASVTEDTHTSVTDNVMTNDSSGADSPASFVAWTSPLNGTWGTLTDNGLGGYTYTLHDDASVQALNKNEHQTDTFTYTMQDADGDIKTATLTVTVNGSNDDPTIVVHTGNQENSNDTVYEAGLTGGTQAGEAETHAGGTFTLADADGLSNIAGITIGTTTIAIADLGHNNVINGSNGTLTITHYDSTTGDVTYTYDLTSPVANAAGSDRSSDSFTVTVHDADSGSSSASIVIDIVDDKPVARDDSASVTEDTHTSVTDNVMTNDSSGADSPASFVAWTSPLNGTWGTLTDNGLGGYTYTLHDDASVQALNKNEHQTDTFTYTMQDADGDIKTATLTVTVNGSNDDPTIVVHTGNQENSNDTVYEAGLTGGTQAGEAETHAGGTFTLADADGLSNIAGITIGTTTIAIADLGHNNVINGSNGTLTITHYDSTTGDVTYTYDLTSPVANAAGSDRSSDSFTVTVHDADSGSSSASIVIDIVDDKPVARDDSASVTEDTHTSVTDNVMTNDSSGADSPASFVAWTSPLNGTWGTLTDNGLGGYTYTLHDDASVQALNKNEHQTDTFTYTMQDADGDIKTATLTVTVNGSNDDPTIVVHTGNQENSNDTVYEAGLTGGTQAGEAETHAGGTFTLADADGLSNIAGITIGTTTIAIADLGHNNVINGSNGTLTITHYDSTTGDVTYTYDLTSPVANAAGSDRSSDSFTVTVHDADSGSSSASIVIDIVDDKPVARDDSASVTEDTHTSVTDNVMTNDSSGADSPASFVAWTSPLNGTWGTLTDNGLGGYTYTLHDDASVQALNKNEHQTDTFTYTMQDADGDIKTATLTVTVNGSNDDPTIVVHTGNQENSNDTVYEAGLTGGTQAGEAETHAGGTFTLADADGLSNIAGITIGTTTIAIADLGHNNVINGSNGTLTITHYDSTTGDVTYTYDLTSPVANAAGSDRGSDSFTVTVHDADSGSSSASIVIDIVDDKPVARDDSASVTEDTHTSVTDNVMTNDSSGADSPASFVAWTSPLNGTWGTLTDNGLGGYTYTLHDDASVQALNKNEHQTDTFTYTMQDADGDIKTATLTVTVNGSNDDPTIVVHTGNQENSNDTVYEAGLTGGTQAGEAETHAGGTFTLADADGLSNIAGITIGTTTIAIADLGHNNVINGSNGTLTITHYDSTTGDVTYTYDLTSPVANAAGSDRGSDSFTVTVHDADSGSSSASIVIDIVDDKPVATPATNNGQSLEQTDTNLMLILDVSGSMGDASGYQGMTRLQVMQKSALELLEQYDALGQVKVNIITFSTSASNPTNAWVSVDQAKSIILGLTANGNTNYDDALNEAWRAYVNDSGALVGAQNVSYFMSDGAPNTSTLSHATLSTYNTGENDLGGVSGIDSNEQTDWVGFLNHFDIKSYSLGMGSGVNQSNLNPIAYDGIHSSSMDSIVVTNLSQLQQTLVSTIITPPLAGDILDGGSLPANAGADGGWMQSVTVNGVTYSFDLIHGTHSVTGGTGTGVFNEITHEWTISTPAGGTLKIDMDDGQYVYTSSGSTTVIQETFGYTVVDGDGDTASSTLTVSVDPAVDPLIVRDDQVITNQSAITIPEWALLANDTGLGIHDVTAISSIAASDSASLHSGYVAYTDNNPSGGSFTYVDSTGSASDTAHVTITQDSSGAIDGTYLNEILIDGNSAGTLNGNAGDDVLIGNGGNDILNGGEGNDILDGGAGNDTLNGGNGNDTAAYIDATSAVTVDLATTTAQNTGGGGTDTLNSIENLIGSSLDDTLSGNSTDNIINGGAGNDHINGGSGNDTIIGGTGNDILTGGTGVDVFKWTSEDIHTPGVAFTDTITDFSRTEGDKLDLSAVLSGDTNDNLSNFLTFSTSGNNVVISVHAEGNPTTNADMTIILEGQSNDLVSLQQYLLTQNGVIH